MPSSDKTRTGKIIRFIWNSLMVASEEVIVAQPPPYRNQSASPPESLLKRW
jgi:hypothetical protein